MVVRMSGSSQLSLKGSLSRDVSGVLYVIGFLAMATGNAVYTGNLLQDLHPFTFLFWSFLATAIIFLVARTMKHGRAAFQINRSAWLPLFILNATSALNWIGYFYALRFIEPAIVSSIMGGVGPIITIGLEWLVRRRHLTLSAAVAGCGILTGTLVLTWGVLSGNSGLEQTIMSSAIIGLASAAFGGTSMALTTIVTKQLGERGWTAGAILAHRFYLLVLVAAALAIGNSQLLPVISSQWVGMAVATMSGVVFPLWLLQRGILLTEPFRVSALLSLAPILTFTFQTFDARIVLSPVSAVGCLIITVFTFYAVVLRNVSR